MLGALDSRLLHVLRTRLHRPAVERAVLAFTRAGEHGGLWLGLAAAGAVADAGRRPAYARAAAAVLGAYGVNTAIKLVVRRRRPRLEGLPPLTGTITGLSYPSAHAATSFAGSGALARAGWPLPPLRAVAAAMALSRPYVGVHYPSDSLAGAALGIAVERLVP